MNIIQAGRLMKIGNIEIAGTAELAPMAGVADRAFRELCVSYGACRTTTEMISAKALTFGDKKSFRLAEIHSTEAPVSVQLFGSDPYAFSEAIKILTEWYNNTNSILPVSYDINMGCPAPKIYKNAAGSSLMKSPSLIEKIVNAAKNASDIPVTVKMRAGFDPEHINAVECAVAAQAGGAAAVTVHARTRDQMYAPPVLPYIIADVKKSVNIPVIGNGDISSPEDAVKMYNETCCDLVSVGRASLGSPWIFSQISSVLDGKDFYYTPSTSERMDIMLQHIAKIIEYKGEHIGILEARKHALWYTKGLPGSASLRREMSNLSSMDELHSIAEKISSI